MEMAMEAVKKNSWEEVSLVALTRVELAALVREEESPEVLERRHCLRGAESLAKRGLRS